MNSKLQTLVDLLSERNAIDTKIAALIGRPAERGHIGEFIAQVLFDIELNKSANHKGTDGIFRSGPLAGRSVNVKFYGTRDLLDMHPVGGPDYYLVLTGPKSAATSSRGTTRPLVIEGIYLFETSALLKALSLRPKPPKVGIATSIATEYWAAATLWPVAAMTALSLTSEQQALLQLFNPRPSALS